MIRNHHKLGQGLTLEGWCLYLACPTGTSHWDRLWTGRLGQAVLVPLGQAQFVPTGTGKSRKRPLLVPWDKPYTHAGGLSLSRDKLYTHDGTCPSSSCPNLSHKEGLQGRGNLQTLKINTRTSGPPVLGTPEGTGTPYYRLRKRL